MDENNPRKIPKNANISAPTPCVAPSTPGPPPSYPNHLWEKSLKFHQRSIIWNVDHVASKISIDIDFDVGDLDYDEDDDEDDDDGNVAIWG